MRLKSDRNLHVLGGNSGTGGVLIESRGEGSTLDFKEKYGTDVISSGIVLKAKDSNTAIIGSQVYIRSQQDDIILDANSGRSQLQSYSSREINFTGSITTLYGAKPELGSVPKSTEYHDSSSVTFGQTGAFSTYANSFISTGNGLFDGNLISRNIATTSGAISSWGAGTQQSIDRAKLTLASALDTVGQYVNEPRLFGRPYHSDTSIGSSTQLGLIGFSSRTDTQYDVDFKVGDNLLFLVEPRWAQVARTESLGSKFWDEPHITSPDKAVKTLPYPGYENWNQNKILGRIDTKYWSVSSGESSDLVPYDTNDQVRNMLYHPQVI